MNLRARTGFKGDQARERRYRALVGHQRAEDVRYNERTSAERVNADLKDKHGGQTVRVRGNAEMVRQLMLGVVAIAAVQTLRLVTLADITPHRFTRRRCIEMERADIHVRSKSNGEKKPLRDTWAKTLSGQNAKARGNAITSFRNRPKPCKGLAQPVQTS